MVKIFGTAVSRFTVRNILSHNPEKCHRGTLLCCVSEKFRRRNVLWIREEGYQDFPSKILCLTVPKKIIEAPICANFHKVSVSENVYGKERGGSVSRFPVESCFCLVIPKSFIGKTFCAVFQKNSGGETVYG